MVKTKNINRTFFDFWAKTYDFGPLKPWLSHLQKKVVKIIETNKSISVLDVGCGTGDSLFYLSKLKNAKLYGVDISRNMILKAAVKLGDKAMFKLAEADDLPFKDNSFDYVLSTEAFHHFPDPESAIKEMKRVLKKKGNLIICDINFRLSFIHKLFKILEPGHVKIYSCDEFRNLFNKCGLRIIKQERIGLFAILTIGKKI